MAAIVGMRTAERLWASMPLTMLMMAIELGETNQDRGQSQTEHEAVFMAQLTLLMLEEAPPEELVWLGQAGE